MGEEYREQNIPEESLFKEYLKLKKLLKKKSLTTKDMNKYGKYSSAVYERRYGGWNNFLKTIGDELNVDTDIRNEDLIEDYFRIKKSLNKPKLSAKDIKDNGKYAISTYVKRFNSWNNFLKSINEL